MKWMTRMTNGLGLGSFVYLFVSLLNKTPPTLTKETVLNVFLISACAGVLSFLFDIERLNFLTALVIHFIGINLVVGLTLFFESWVQNITWMSYLGSMFIFYSCSWLALVIRNKLIAIELNQWIKRHSDRSQY